MGVERDSRRNAPAEKFAASLFGFVGDFDDESDFEESLENVEGEAKFEFSRLSDDTKLWVLKYFDEESEETVETHVVTDSEYRSRRAE